MPDCLLVFCTFPAHLCSLPGLIRDGSLELHLPESLASRVQPEIPQIRGICRKFEEGKEVEVTIPFHPISYNTPNSLHSSPLDLFALSQTLQE